MEEAELQKIWKAQDEKLERSLKLHAFLLESLQTQKVSSKLNKLAAFKTIAVMIGILWIAFLGILIYSNNAENMYFTISVAMIMLFTIVAIVFYIKHIVLIKSIDYSQTITYTQEKLAKLQLSTIQIVRILWLQMPFHTTWFWTHEQVTGDTRFQLISFPITILFTLLAIWLYKNISVKNLDKKWLKILMNAGPEYRFVSQARDFLYQVEEFKK